MAVKSKMTKQDISFLKTLINDITSELCDCDCFCKEKGCSIFERVYIAANILYNKIADFDNNTDYYNVLNDPDSCVNWETISERVNYDSMKKGKFVDKSRKKILSRFYKNLYDFIDSQTSPVDIIPAYNTDYEDLDLSVFNNAQNVINNCLDECCN